MGDPGRIRQVILNLLSNAIKFTHEGTIVITFELDSSESTDTILKISVQDSGIGIPQSKISMVFDKFEQAERSTTRQYGGTGLGLPICKQLVQLMGGEIGVESELGLGSCFWFTVKLEDSNADQTPSETQNLSSLSGLRCLIANNSAISRMILSELLTDCNMQVEVVASTEQALKSLQSAKQQGNAFDMLVTEYDMPIMTGAELAKEVKISDDFNDLCMLLVTGSPKIGDGKTMHELGFNGYLCKPVSPQDLLGVMCVIWDNKKTHLDNLVTSHTIKEAKSKVCRSFTLNSPRVLLVEDNPVNQMIASSMLHKYNIFATMAVHGGEAVELCKKNDYDLIFMDCQMPVMNGFSASKHIRALEEKKGHTRTAIIAFTANAMESDRQACLDAGMDDFVTKPVQRLQIEAVLLKWMADKVIMLDPEGGEASTLKEHSASNTKPD